MTRTKQANIVPALKAAAGPARRKPRTRDPEYMIPKAINPQKTEQNVCPRVLMAVWAPLTWTAITPRLLAASPMKLQNRSIDN